ncbi:MAG: histidine kinase, partial [Nitrospinae bacterium]|nr:histidine kinase [Nitrospinota bacterium]
QGTLTVSTALHAPPQRPSLSTPEQPTPAHELLISVMDTGPGIPPEMKEKIFEPFYSTKKGGTGLGLATVDRIICNHMGRIAVDVEPGHGTTMRIHLPFLHASSADRGDG